MQDGNRTVRLRVSPAVARIVSKDAPRDLQLAAARGELQMGSQDLLHTLLFLAHGGDPELRRLCLATLQALPAKVLIPLLADSGAAPQLLDFVARVRVHDPEIMEPLLAHPAVTAVTVARLAAVASPPVLFLLRRSPLAAAPEVAAALAANPHLARIAPGAETGSDAAAEDGEDTDARPAETEEAEAAEGDAEEGEEAEAAEEEIDPSKYKQAMSMEVAEKIKMALTGDKEWRTIFIKDPNKLVSSAVLKNPRITEGEVLTIAKNKSAHDELIRLIVMNREWVKEYQIKKALVVHPKTPLPKALRFMDVLTLKDIKGMAKSRSISPVLVNNARRIIMAREKKR
jgi:hypothetical protein